MKKSNIYRPVTIWQNEYFHIDVDVPRYFSTIQAAAEFANICKKLQLREGRLYLTIDNGEDLELDDSHITLKELTVQARQKLCIGDSEDFADRDIPVADWSSHEILKGTWGSLAYGVKDGNGNAVSLPLRSLDTIGKTATIDVIDVDVTSLPPIVLPMSNLKLKTSGEIIISTQK